MLTPDQVRAIRTAVTVQPATLAWTTPTLTGASNVGSGYQGARYAKVPSTGMVIIQGWVTVSNTTATTMFTLPAGYRPALALALAVGKYAGSTYSMVGLSVQASGAVVYPAGLTAGDALYLNGITFPAEA